MTSVHSSRSRSGSRAEHCHLRRMSDCRARVIAPGRAVHDDVLWRELAKRLPGAPVLLELPRFAPLPRREPSCLRSSRQQLRSGHRKRAHRPLVVSCPACTHTRAPRSAQARAYALLPCEAQEQPRSADRVTARQG